MGNSVVPLFGNNAALPAHFVGREVDEMTKKLAGGGSGKRISIKGAVWRMIDGGQQVAVHDSRNLEVVIVKSAEHDTRQFYEGVYVEGENKPPSCYSNNGITPEDSSPNKQSATCATCPKNAAGSGSNGQSRACRFSHNLAVALANNIGGSVFKLTIPAQSLFGKGENGVWPLKAYAKHLAANNVSVSWVVTEMRFDVNSATPKIVFRPLRPLDSEETDLAEAQGASLDALDAITNTVFQQDSKPASAPPKASTPPQHDPEVDEPPPAALPAGVTLEMVQAVAAQMAAQKAGAAVVPPKAAKNAGPVTKDTSATLSKWETEDD